MSKDSKVSQFQNFDFDGNDSWKNYLEGVEISSASKDSLISKLKAKWYKKEIDPDFEIEWVTGARPATQPTSNPSRPSSTYTPSSSSSSSSNNRSYGSGSSFGNSYAAGTSGLAAGAVSGTPTQQKVSLFLYLAVILFGLFALPISPFAGLAGPLFMRVAGLAFGYRVYISAGIPTSFRPWSNVTAYLQKVFMLPEAHFFLTSLTFAQQPLLFAIGPLWIRAVYQAVALAEKHYSASRLWQLGGAKLQKVLAEKHSVAALGSAMSEIVLGLVLGLLLLTPRRNLLTLVFWWQMLKMRFHMSTTSAYHRQAWRMLGEKTSPIRSRVPIIQKAVAFGEKWFSTIPQ